MALSVPVRLWTQTHEDESVTVSVLDASSFALWGLERAPLVEELLLAWSDRLERAHPQRLEGVWGAHMDALTIELPEALPLLGSDESRLPLRFSVLTSRQGAFRVVWIPRLDARLWIGADQDGLAEATALAQTLVARLDASRRLALQLGGEGSLEVVEIAVAPAALARFTGPEGPRDVLPEPAPAEETSSAGQRRPPTPTLRERGQPLHEFARAGRLGRAWERDADVQRLVDLLAARPAPIVVLGPRGVGKSAVLDEVARRITSDEAPPSLRGHPAWYVDADRLIAGLGGFGGWQQQVLDILREMVVSEATWFIGSLLPLLNAGRSAQSDHSVAQMLGPAFATGELRVIGECHDADWAQLQLRDPGFAGLFVPVRLEEPALEVTRAIVDREAQDLPVQLDAGARRAVLELAARYGRRDSRVGASVGLLRRVVSAVQAEGADRCDRYRVVRHLCEETGIPPVVVRDDLPLDRDALVARFRARILGQEAVIEQMADLIVRIKAGLADDRRPLGAYLFLGPTGVGKTETVKALAEILYGRSDRVLRFDMSEYAGADCIDRLLGADASTGLVGRVAQTPFAVVLLDEIEKAHPAVFDVLLQVLGEARLTDRAGRVADFRNTIVLMTSNLGVGTFRRPSGFRSDEGAALRDHLLAEVKRFFRPEWVGRLDAVVPFEPLDADPIRAITDRELQNVRRRDGFAGRGLALVLDPEVPGWLAERGVDLRYGARPLKRAIERQLVAPIARMLSDRNLVPRAVQVTVDGTALRIRATESSAVPLERARDLRGALDTLSQLRYALRRWADVPVLREARQHVRLVHRLADTRAFWRDEAAARVRLAAAEDPARVVQAYEQLLGQVEALEDLVLECWAGQTAAAETVLALTNEVRAAEVALRDLEWTIGGLQRTERDALTMWFAPARPNVAHDHRTMEPLVLAYVRLAVRAGFSLRVAVRPGVEWEHPGDGEAPGPADLQSERARWREHPDELTRDDPVLAFFRSRSTPHALVELRIRGRHAATMLEGEAGLHSLEPADRPSGDVVVVTWPSSADPARERLLRLRPPRETVRQRSVSFARDRLRDHVLGRQTGIGVLHEQLADLLHARLLARMFE